MQVHVKWSGPSLGCTRPCSLHARAARARLCGRLLLLGLLSVAAGPVLVHVRIGRPWQAGVRVIRQAAGLDASDARRMDAWHVHVRHALWCRSLPTSNCRSSSRRDPKPPQ